MSPASRNVRPRNLPSVNGSGPRIGVRKTYKLYIGGAFPRSESGRSYLVSAADDTPLANACRASRKDLRDAVRAARKAFDGWADRSAMNRGQVLYRVAELMEGRREQFVAEVAPEQSSLLGLVSRLAPPLVAGNAVVVLASETRPLPAVTLTEVLATSDVPGGVVNVLTGLKRELVPVLAGHVDVDAIDVWGVPDDLRTDVELIAADNVKRLSRRPAGTTDARFDWLDDRVSERPE